MASRNKVDKASIANYYIRPVRPLVPVPSHDESQELLTVQGKSDSVAKLYQDFVLGRLDQSQIGGEPVYDEPGSESVDPFNTFGLTLEETTAIADRGREADADIRRYQKIKSDAANAKRTENDDNDTHNEE